MRHALKTAVAVAAAAALSAGGAQAAPKFHECQHPVVTGEEAYNLHHVSVKTACGVVRDLGRFERHTGNIAKLYTCGGAGHHTPKLKKHAFEGWRLSITKAGDFQMSQGKRSFDVGGTDFPVSCA
jgi:hypothetical protein